MSNNIVDILAAKRNFHEPNEIGIIKTFVFENFHHTPQVAIRQTQIIISVPGAALAGALRMRQHELQELCKTEKRLTIRIGG